MSVKVLKVEELKQKMDKNSQDYILIDCREQKEWDEVHIDSAKLIPLSEFDDKTDLIDNNEKLVIIHCRSGKRSLDACMRLLQKGYKNIANLEGGILDWVEQGYPVSSS